jgi:acetate kinase
MTQRIAVINAGSSSIKFGLFEEGENERLLFRGQIENIGVGPRLSVEDPNGEKVTENKWGAKELDHSAATMVILKTMIGLLGGASVAAVGHRVVHGGTMFTGPTLVTEETIVALRTLCPLAPLHQPHNLAPIEAISRAAPHMPQVACFDTAFHQSQSPLAQAFALPHEMTESGIRRYGFHGLSYQYVSGKLREIAPDHADKRIVIAHLGNGASLCALHEGHSVATTMGFTAVEGLMMGTRCGSIDPGVLIYLMDERKLDARGIERLIYKESGLLGVSGISSDMRTLRSSKEPRAREAIDLFVYRIVREIGSLAAALGGLEGLVFTGGIGQRDVLTRREIVAGCSWLGAALDEEANSRGEDRIDAASSSIPIWVLPTDEERTIARSTAAVLAEAAPSATATADTAPAAAQI